MTTDSVEDVDCLSFAFSLPSHVHRRRMSRPRTLSRRAWEALMQEDEPRRPRPPLRPASIAQHPPHRVMAPPLSPPCDNQLLTEQERPGESALQLSILIGSRFLAKGFWKCLHSFTSYSSFFPC